MAVVKSSGCMGILYHNSLVLAMSSARRIRAGLDSRSGWRLGLAGEAADGEAVEVEVIIGGGDGVAEVEGVGDVVGGGGGGGPIASGVAGLVDLALVDIAGVLEVERGGGDGSVVGARGEIVVAK